MNGIWIGAALLAGLACSGGNALAQAGGSGVGGGATLGPAFPDLRQLFVPPVERPQITTPQVTTPRPQGVTPRGPQGEPGQGAGLAPRQGGACPFCLPGGEIFGSGASVGTVTLPGAIPGELYPKPSPNSGRPPQLTVVIEQVSNATIGLYNNLGLPVDVTIEGGQQAPVAFQLVAGQLLSVALNGTASMRVSLASGTQVQAQPGSGPVSAGRLYQIRAEGRSLRFTAI